MLTRAFTFSEQMDPLFEAEDAIKKKDYAALVDIGRSLVSRLRTAPRLFDAILPICNLLADQEKYWPEICDLLMGSVRNLDTATVRGKDAMAALVRHACLPKAPETENEIEKEIEKEIENIAALQFVATRIVPGDPVLHKLKMRALGAIVERARSWPAEKRLRLLRNAITAAGIRHAKSQESEPNASAYTNEGKAIIAAFFEAVGDLPEINSRIAIVGNEAEVAQPDSMWERTCVDYVLKQISGADTPRERVRLYKGIAKDTRCDDLLRSPAIHGLLQSVADIRTNKFRVNTLASIMDVAGYPQKLEVLAAYLQYGIDLTANALPFAAAGLLTKSLSETTPVTRDAQVLSSIMEEDTVSGWPIAPRVIVHLLERNPVDAPSALVAHMLDVIKMAKTLREGVPTIPTVQRVAQFNKKHGRAAPATP